MISQHMVAHQRGLVVRQAARLLDVSKSTLPLGRFFSCQVVDKAPRFHVRGHVKLGIVVAGGVHQVCLVGSEPSALHLYILAPGAWLVAACALG